MADPASVAVRIGPKTKLRVYIESPGEEGKVQHTISTLRPGGFFGAPYPVPFPTPIYAEWYDDSDYSYCYGVIDIISSGPGVEPISWESIYQWMPVGQEPTR